MRTSRTLPVRACVLLILACVLPVGAAPGRGGERRSDDNSLFSAKEYLGYVSTLASNEMEGRGTGQEGNEKAANYIAGIFKKDGLTPAGDDDSYFQNFTLKLESRIGERTYLALGAKGRSNRRRLDLYNDFVPMPFSEVGRFSGEVVFVGYGIVNGKIGYDDYAGVDVAAKVVLVLCGAPGFAEFSPEEDMSFPAKASKANARDAAAILMVNCLKDLKPAEGAGDRAEPGADALPPFERNSPGFMGFGRENHGIPMLQIKRSVADRMLKAGGLPDLATLERRIERDRGPVSKPLKGVSVSGEVEIQPIDTPVRNVVGLIPGTGPNADEIMVCGAHYDHVGVFHKGEPGFDPEKDIYNGADDNASGTAMLLTMAKAYTKGSKPNRSILLIAFTGEEMGLFGSEHFVRHPTVDLDKCVAMLNFDMVGRLKNNSLEVGGMRTGEFEDAILRRAKSYGLKIKDGGGGLGPSDHASFYAAKMPVLFFFTGLHKQYHKPQDDANLINSEGAMRIARLTADLIDEIDAKSTRPEFKADARGFTLETQQEEDGAAGEADQPADGEKPDQADDGDHVVLGVSIRTEEGPGVQVRNVARNSPAKRAGVKRNDRIVKLGEATIDTAEELAGAVRRLKKGDKATLVVERKGVSLNLEVQFGDGKDGEASGQQFGEAGKALASLAKRLKNAPTDADPHPAVSWQPGLTSLSLVLHTTDEHEAAKLLDEARVILDRIPKDSEYSASFAIKVEITPSKGTVTEVSITLQKSKPAADSAEQKSPPDGVDKKKRARASKATALLQRPYLGGDTPSHVAKKAA